MPKTDYSDAAIKFPRLQVRIFADGERQLVDTWLWKKAGSERHQLTKSQRADSMDYAHRLIGEFKITYVQNAAQTISMLRPKRSGRAVK